MSQRLHEPVPASAQQPGRDPRRDLTKGARGQPIDDVALVERIRAFVPIVLRITGTPGINLAIGRRGRVIWEEGFGQADLALGIPMTATHTAKVGSLSKLYTAVAIMQLVERGVLDLYGPVDEYVDGFAVLNPLGERHVTIYDLLTHRSGLALDTYEAGPQPPGPLGSYLQSQYTTPWSREYAGARGRWLAKTGAAFQYSNLGLATLGYVVSLTNPEALSFPAYIRRNIFEPLGMTSSAFVAHDEDREHLAGLLGRLSVGYARFGRTFIPTPLVYSLVPPAAGLVTTAGDHLRLLMALLGEGDLQGSRILAPTSARFMTTPQVDIDVDDKPSGISVGLVMQLCDLDGPRGFFGHSASFPHGWYHDSRAYPRSDLAVVGLANRWDAVRWTNPSAELAPSVIADYAASLTEAHALPDVGIERSWEWRAAYVMGAVLVDRCRALFGISEPWQRPDTEAMIAGAHTVGGADAEDWDPDGFRAGVRDMLRLDCSPAAIQTFVKSADFGVAASELPLINLSFGRRGDLPLPMPYFARPAGPGRRRPVP